MMVSTPDEATEVYPIVVHDSIGPLSIEGWKIAELSWTYEEVQARGYSRWTDMALYGVHGSDKMKYVVQITGRSVVYHRPDGSCSQGVSMPVGKLYTDKDFYDALVACRVCKPEDLDDIGNHGQVKIEVNLPKLYRCRDAKEVVRSLYSHGTRNGEPSSLSVKILSAAAMVDSDIQQALLTMRRT
jgi:hypothetical protein